MPKCDKCNADFDSEFLQNGLCSFCFVANAQHKEKEESDELGLVQMKVWVYPELISSVNQYIEDLNKQHGKND